MQGPGVGRHLMTAVIERGAESRGIRLFQDSFNMSRFRCTPRWASTPGTGGGHARRSEVRAAQRHRRASARGGRRRGVRAAVPKSARILSAPPNCWAPSGHRSSRLCRSPRRTDHRIRDKAVFEAVLEGWARRQRSRLLSQSTIGMRDRLIHHFAECSPSAIRGLGVPLTSRQLLAYFNTSRASNGAPKPSGRHRAAPQDRARLLQPRHTG